ncbi:MAG: hypothetical protein JOZ86_04310, partial [Candidatus Eremiobacteraeota bacterium]|nr:hypothetical protein [Candidatus Eremiobacteraeota bacterium]
AASAYDATGSHGERSATMRALTARVLDTFLARYAESAHDLPTLPPDPAQREALIRFFRVAESVRDVHDALARYPGQLAAAVDALQVEVRALA